MPGSWGKTKISQSSELTSSLDSITHFQASFASGDTATCSGSLGELQVRNLLSPSLVHQRIISVGREPLAQSEGGAINPDMGEAFTFGVEQREGGILGQDERLVVSLHISFLVYTHSSAFLEELNNCATDLKRYKAGLAQSITAAAIDLAMGIVAGADSRGVYIS